MIPLKTPEQIADMREGGKILGGILQSLLEESHPGVSLLNLEEHAKKRIKDAGGLPSFTTVEDYQWVTCLCINDQVVHGIPRPYILNAGDVFTIDVGMLYKGFHTDTARTICIRGEGQPVAAETDRFLKTGQLALEKAIGEAREGNRLGTISLAIQMVIEEAGYSVVKSLTGHGVGKKLHEEPLIPGFADKQVDRTPLLTAGMTLAIEVIYAVGKGQILYDSEDGWTLASKDRSLTAVFEHSVAITGKKTVVLTEAGF